MSKFFLSRRPMQVGKINPRSEFHGADRVPATDIPVHWKGTKRDIDMLMRCCLPDDDSEKFSDVLYKNKRFMFPDIATGLPINRKPEHLIITIWDQPTKKTAFLKFQDCTVKSIVIDFADSHRIQGKMLLQIGEVDPDRDAARLYSMMDSEVDIEVEGTQEDFGFGDGEDDKKDKKQGDLVDQSKGEEEEEEEDDEN